MRIFERFCLILLAVPVTLAVAQGHPNALTPTEAAQGWMLLFDGKDLGRLAALEHLGAGSQRDWRVADGAILCPGTSAGWLASKL